MTIASSSLNAFMWLELQNHLIYIEVSTKTRDIILVIGNIENEEMIVH